MPFHLGPLGGLLAIAASGIACAGLLVPRPALGFDYSPARFQAALGSGKPTVLELGATWCQGCVKLAPVVEELKHGYDGRLSVLSADVTDAAGLARDYAAVGIPAFVFFNAEGRRVRTLVGYRDEAALRQLFDGLLERPAAAQSQVDSRAVGSAPTSGQEVAAALPPAPLVVRGAHREEERLTLEVVLSLDQLVLPGTLAVALDGEPLQVTATVPDVSGEATKDAVFVAGGQPIRVVASPGGAPPVARTSLDAQLTVQQFGC